MTGANNMCMLKMIRDNFRKGIPSENHELMIKNMENAYKILADIGGKELVGKNKNLASGTFWFE